MAVMWAEKTKTGRKGVVLRRAVWGRLIRCKPMLQSDLKQVKSIVLITRAESHRKEYNLGFKPACLYPENGGGNRQ